jgi:hypothetical protein
MSISSSFFARRRRAGGASLRQRRDRAMRQPSFEGLEARIALTTNVWTGAAAQSVQDTTWSNALNWSQGTPQTGQDLVFPTASASTFIPTQAIVNDLSNMTFDSIEIDAPGYTLAGDAISLTAATALFTTYSSGVSTFKMTANLGAGNIDVASGGELDIDGDLSGSNGVISVGAGILGGTGQITGLTVQDGEVQPGVAGGGDLTVVGTTTFDQNTTFSTSISGSGINTAINSFGVTDINLESPNLNLSIAPGFTPALGTAFTIIQGKISGNFNGLAQGASFTAGGSTFRVSYGTQGAVLTAVEPTTLVTTTQSGASTSVFGQSVTFVATLSDAGGSPTGTVTFEDGGSVLGTAPVNSGVADFPTTQLTLGQNAITAVYSGDAHFAASTAPAFDDTVSQASTTTTVTSSANPSATGEIVTFTAAVAPIAPGGGTPTGSVTFFNGSTQLAVAPLSVGSASYSTSALALGSYAISAVYSGDTDFLGSASPSITQNVNEAGSNTTTSSSANPSVFGQSVTFTAQVTAAAPGLGTPTGTVSFFDGNTELDTARLIAGAASYSTSDLTRGGHFITAVYSGDASFGPSTSVVLIENVNQASTQTTVTPSPAATILGQSVTFNADVAPVSPGTGVPTGMVTFMDGSTPLETVTLDAGTASFSTSSLTLGSHSITVAYAGDGDDFLASTSSPSIEEVGGTTVTLVSPFNPSTFGQSFAFTAKVAPDAAGSTVPIGSVTFMDGTQSLGTFALNAAGVASTPLEHLSAGTHPITAVYAGNADFAASTSTVLDQLVNPATTSTAITPSVSNSTFGESVTFDATVTSAAGSPTGSVTFKDGSKVLATVSVNSSGVAAYPSSSLTVGAHDLVATYTSASGNFSPSTSSELVFDVAQAATTTVLTTSSSTPSVGQPVTFTATVAEVGSGLPTGTVVFHDGSTVIGTVPLSTGMASLTVAYSGVGSKHVIEATYDGSTAFTSSNSTDQILTVVPATPITTLVATPRVVGSKVRGATLEVSVRAEFPGGPVPSGSVTFDIGHRKLRTVPLLNGSASVTISAAKATGKSFVVRYLGDTSDKAEVSNSIHIGRKFFKAKSR